MESDTTRSIHRKEKVDRKTKIYRDEILEDPTAWGEIISVRLQEQLDQEYPDDPAFRFG